MLNYLYSPKLANDIIIYDAFIIGQNYTQTFTFTTTTLNGYTGSSLHTIRCRFLMVYQSINQSINKSINQSIKLNVQVLDKISLILSHPHQSLLLCGTCFSRVFAQMVITVFYDLYRGIHPMIEHHRQPRETSALYMVIICQKPNWSLTYCFRNSAWYCCFPPFCKWTPFRNDHKQNHQ